MVIALPTITIAIVVPLSFTFAAITGRAITLKRALKKNNKATD